MKRYAAFVVMYLAMAWWFLCTGIYFAVAMPAKMLVDKLGVVVGADNTPKFESVGKFNIN